MATEWKRASWVFSPITLSHTPSHIVKAIHSFLTQCGWEYAPWSATGDDRHYLRADRWTAKLTQDAVGASGNVAVTKVGANITVTGMSGGSVSAKATGTIQLTGLPADGNTVTIGDGTTTITFEFDNNASVGGGNTSVTIGATVMATLDALIAAINASALATTAQELTRIWRYTGDGPEQACGLRVRYDVGNSRIAISAFIENSAAGALYKETPTAQIPWYTYDLTAANDVLFIGGEDGLYIEVGRDGTPNNLAHLMIGTFQAIPEFAGTKDRLTSLSAQGLAMDMFGPISPKFSSDRNGRFVDNNGSNRNYTALLSPAIPRGTANLVTPVQADALRQYMAPRDNFIGVLNNGSSIGGSGLSTIGYVSTFAMVNSPVDDNYKLSPMWYLQHFTLTAVATSSANVSNNLGADSSFCWMTETRWLRQVPRLMAVDQTLIPNNNLPDPITGKTYRIAQIADFGRTMNCGIEWPTSGGDVVTIPATPVV